MKPANFTDREGIKVYLCNKTEAPLYKPGSVNNLTVFATTLGTINQG